MRDNVRAFVQVAAECFQAAGPVYEFGSYLVDGQQQIANLRGIFAGRQFVGCDLRAGPGVDRVEDLARLSLPDETARTIVCVDTLEHVFEARRAVEEMLRVLAPGGLILLAAPMDFRVHAYPSDYWRLTPSCVQRLLDPLPATAVGWQGVESHPHTVFGIGGKAPVDVRFIESANRFMASFQSWLANAEAGIGRIAKWKRSLLSSFRSKGERRRLRDHFQARFMLHAPSGAGKQALLGLAGGWVTGGSVLDSIR